MDLKEEQQIAIREAQQDQRMTKRPTVMALEEVLYEPFPVLDHGFVRVIDYMGNDMAVVQAARVSYGRGTTRVRDDRGLIRYLMRHRHSTPFEMCEIKFHIKLPIFVARQWIRHRMASVNEYSARYSVLDKEFYLPDPALVGVQSVHNRQGRGESLSSEQAAAVLDILKEDAERCYQHYTTLLNDPELGDVDPSRQPLSRELARMNLTLNHYTQWYWKADLHNLLHFLMLRLDAHAQYEIRVYAEQMAKLVEKWVPFCWEAFSDYRLKSTDFSFQELQVLRLMLKGEMANLEQSGLSKREQEEFLQKIS